MTNYAIVYFRVDKTESAQEYTNYSRLYNIPNVC